ncbi:hypothetical protein RB653_008637 [Dictyostelium firmibasis]|uniref:Uncharacterized protein n=1 Tax=Dictyostelium firmibasis TaxID=79012 RepID=A0AAN7YWR2_9MYCE
MDTTPNNRGVNIKFISNKKVLWPEDIASKLFSQYQTMLGSKLYSKDMDIVEILATTSPFKGVYTLEQIKSKIKNQKHSLSMKNLALQKISQQNESPPQTPTTSNGSMMTRRQNANNTTIGSNNNNNNNNNINTNTSNSSNTSINGDDDDDEEDDREEAEEDDNITNRDDSDSYDDFSIAEESTEIREVQQDIRSFKKVKLNSLTSLNEGYVSTPQPPIEMVSPNRNNNSFNFSQDQDGQSHQKQQQQSINFSNQSQQLQNLINATTIENKKLKQSLDQLEFQLKMEKEQNLKLKNLVTKLNEEIQFEKEISKQINKSICSNLNISNCRSISTNSVIFKKDSNDNSIVAIFPTFITTTNLNSSDITLTIDPNPPENYHKIIIKQQQTKQQYTQPQIQTYLIKKLQDYYDPEPCLIGSTNSKGVYFKSKDKSLLKISIDNLRDFD